MFHKNVLPIILYIIIQLSKWTALRRFDCVRSLTLRRWYFTDGSIKYPPLGSLEDDISNNWILIQVHRKRENIKKVSFPLPDLEPAQSFFSQTRVSPEQPSAWCKLWFVLLTKIWRANNWKRNKMKTILLVLINLGYCYGDASTLYLYQASVSTF